jgi:DNA-binding MarR family transcriptional regulator
MQSDDLATRFEFLFRQTFALAARRVRDKREIVSTETLALLEHMAALGPATLTELTAHLDRAPSTLSEMLEPLIARGWVERDRDPQDGRRYLLWLSPLGQSIRIEQQRVLDLKRISAALDALPAPARDDLFTALTALNTALISLETEDD